jgi:hypothetical protein
MAHGLDQGGDGLKLIIRYVNRAGKEIKVEISPETHDGDDGRGRRLA